ncbi:TetR family transcriptional regulator C-terminal domain-containing protein [bacterium SCSIO 12696]|nr:TetR family transcriptional regulator C-terminal domain-containing protein [bacterium SCSIO 12696]
MSKRASKKDHILAAGMAVMKSQGFNGTSVRDIVDAAGVPKGSFYNYFDSKEVFAVEALQSAAAEDQQINSKILGDRQQPPLSRLRNYFVHHVQEVCDNDFRIGCFLGNICQEMADSSEAIRLAVREVLQTNTRQLATVMEEAKERGDLPENADTELLAEFVFNAWQGALVRMKATKNSQPMDIFLGTYPRLLQP